MPNGIPALILIVPVVRFKYICLDTRCGDQKAESGAFIKIAIDKNRDPIPLKAIAPRKAFFYLIRFAVVATDAYIEEVLVIKYFKCGLMIGGKKKLADIFQTSNSSILFRIYKLQLFPIAMVYVHHGIVSYWLKSHDLYGFFKNCTKLSPPEDSVAQEYIDVGYSFLYRADENAQEISKSTWFELKTNEKDTPFWEYCIPFKESQSLLSVIWEA